MTKYSNFRDFRLDSTEELDLILTSLMDAKRHASMTYRISGLSDAQKVEMQAAADLLMEAYKNVLQAQLIIDKAGK